jgi:hypothetical protein
VKADRIGGTLTVENSNASVTATAINQNVDVRTSFGPVSLDGVGGNVAVTNQNGSVEVSGVAATKSGTGCNNVIVRTSFAPLRVYLSDKAGFAVSAKTSFGKIVSDLPVTASGELSSRSLTGQIGNGGCELNLTNGNGNIEILNAAKKR